MALIFVTWFNHGESQCEEDHGSISMPCIEINIVQAWAGFQFLKVDNPNYGAGHCQGKRSGITFITHRIFKGRIYQNDA